MTTTAVPNAKFALLFLTVDNPIFPTMWDNWVGDNESCVDIYIHPKYPDQLTWRRDRMIPHVPNNSPNKQVQAYGALISAAVNHALSNQFKYVKYVIITESCIPLQAFDQFSNLMCKYPNISYYIDAQTRPNSGSLVGGSLVGGDPLTQIKSQLVGISDRNRLPIYQVSDQFALCHTHAVKFARTYSAVFGGTIDTSQMFAAILFTTSNSAGMCLSALADIDLATDPAFINYAITHNLTTVNPGNQESKHTESINTLLLKYRGYLPLFASNFYTDEQITQFWGNLN